jgi:hypothetical protein
MPNDFYLEEPVVGADDQLGGDRAALWAGCQVGVVALDPGHCPGLGLKVTGSVDVRKRFLVTDYIPDPRGPPRRTEPDFLAFG